MDNNQVYSIAQNVFININTTRYKFYQELYKLSENEIKNSYEDIIAVGIKSGFSHKMTEDEIIGCLYANFLTHDVKNNSYHITDRAISDFFIYEQDAKYKYNFKNFTFSFYFLLCILQANFNFYLRWS